MMRQSAVAHDFHADTATPSEIAKLNGVSPITVNVAVWRGADDDEIVASGMDGLDHVGRVWLSFDKGSEPQQFALFRTDLLRQVKRKWPETRLLPIMPSGAIPLPSDLIRTPDDYKVKPASEPKYRK